MRSRNWNAPTISVIPRISAAIQATSATTERFRDLLASEPVNADAAEVSLGYRLRQHHVALIAWVTGQTHGSDGLERLERLASAANRQLGPHGRPLFVPRDEALAWIWLPLGDDSISWPASVFDNDDVSVRAAVGEPAYGIDGFRRTHLQGARAQGLALAAQPGARVTSFADVGAVALIRADVPAARSWVWATLGDLAIDDVPHARLRETLWVFLSTGSYIATAERLVLHKNSVQYRIRKPEKALGAPLEDRRADIELALRACHYLGRTVLRDPDAPSFMTVPNGHLLRRRNALKRDEVRLGACRSWRYPSLLF